MAQRKGASIWLTLSKADTAYERRMAISELFYFFGEPIKRKDINIVFWQELYKLGFRLHPLLEKKAIDQEVCFYCGGQVLKVEGIDPENYEFRCVDCTYLYSEK